MIAALRHFSRQLSGPSIATFLARMLVGVIFTMAGYWKVFELGAHQHAQQFFVEGFQEYWLPEWFLYPLGWIIPFVELIGGLLLVLGWRTRLSLSSLGLLLIVTTYGHALRQPLFDIDGHTFTRMALILFVLMQKPGVDCLGLDFWLHKRRGQA
jgi:thiosulfate dehydrogenase [quinone] large subunit